MDFNQALQDFQDISGSNMFAYFVPQSALYRGAAGGQQFCRAGTFNSKVEQAIGYLDGLEPPDEKLVEIGTLYNSIQDEELKRRCADLLTARSDFDRAINQATQVLEDRIRKKSGGTTAQTGVALVNEMIKAVPAKSVLVLSREAGEQEGMSNIARGLMQAFRNQTHHEISDRFSWEDALKVCAFIDLILRSIDGAQVSAR